MREPRKPKRFYRLAKRAFDMIISMAAIALLCVPCALVGFAIKASDGGPALHKRICVGKDGRPFPMLKFRSMVVDADDLDRYLTEGQKALYLMGDKSFEDPRITKVGKFLREHNIDELPQLVNVLLGQMSLVGPRPVTAYEASCYGEKADELLSVRPGITGYWQVMGRSSVAYLSDEARELQLHYVRNQGFGLDAKILLLTIRALFRKTGR